jgi:hypothetical protein
MVHYCNSSNLRDNTIQYHGKLQTRKLSQAPILLGRCYHLNCFNRWSDCVGNRIEILYIYNLILIILQQFTQNEIQFQTAPHPWHYIAGKVAISQHLVNTAVPPVLRYCWCRQAQCKRWHSLE